MDSRRLLLRHSNGNSRSLCSVAHETLFVIKKRCRRSGERSSFVSAISFSVTALSTLSHRFSPVFFFFRFLSTTLVDFHFLLGLAMGPELVGKRFSSPRDAAKKGSGATLVHF